MTSNKISAGARNQAVICIHGNEVWFLVLSGGHGS